MTIRKSDHNYVGSCFSFRAGFNPSVDEAGRLAAKINRQRAPWKKALCSYHTATRQHGKKKISLAPIALPEVAP